MDTEMEDKDAIKADSKIKEKIKAAARHRH